MHAETYSAQLDAIRQGRLDGVKKPIAAALLFSAAAIILLLPRDVHQLAPASRPPGIPPDPAPAPPSRSDIVALAVPADRAGVQTLAAEWRRMARGDAGFRERLRRLILDVAAPSKTRELAALVLGTLADREGLAVLA
ncbi:MAG TPA: hypothetical protein VFS19_00640, partial [Planctomycetota bacterium]|nr:hypothetical protein [Planctomycetota bacterium]